MATILLVDNDAFQALQRKSILERRFQDVQRVGDASEALCLIEQPQFAENLGLIISEEHMQGIGGPAFVAELHSRLPRVPVLVLGTANDSLNDYAGTWIHFLPRPFTNEELLAVAGDLLAQRQLNPA
jgi:DNA-binding NtrC family response regulator